MLLYSLLHLTGYDLSLGELKRYRQWGSRAPGKEVLGRYGFTVENVVARVLGLLITTSKGGIV